MNDDLGRMWKEALYPSLWDYPNWGKPQKRSVAIAGFWPGFEINTSQT
jgi:hypothetical protein